MKIALSGIRAVHGDWTLAASGIFNTGIHLVSGDIGSGKTTLALLLAGMFIPSAGRIEHTDIRSAMVAFQFPEFHITGEDLADECRAWGIDPVPFLSSVGLTEKMRMNPLDLSRGELKRLVLACVLAKDYDLLILDEPFSSLDCTEKERLCHQLSGRKERITIILTHERSYFPRVDQIWEIQEGVLHDRGRLPSALAAWVHAPSVVKDLIARGKIPANISQADLLEAACRI